MQKDRPRATKGNLFELVVVFVNKLQNGIITYEEASKFLHINRRSDQRLIFAPQLLSQLLTPVRDLPFGARTKNIFKYAAVYLLGELIQKSEGDLLRFRNFGRYSLAEVTEKLDELGLCLGIELRGKLKHEFDKGRSEILSHNAL